MLYYFLYYDIILLPGSLFFKDKWDQVKIVHNKMGES